MENEKKAREFLEKFCACRPKNFFKDIDDRSRGLYVILHMLETCGDVSAGEISAKLAMSTPRVAAALNALEGKRFIERRQSPDDARRVIVHLTDAGRAEHEARERTLVELTAQVIDEVGERELDEFLRISARIRDAVSKRIR